MNGWSQIIQHWLFPSTCLLCGAAGTSTRDLCRGCAEDLPLLGRHCPRCALPLPAPAPVGSLCGRCQQSPPEFDRTIAAVLYREPVRHMVHALKFHRRYAFARLLGGMLAETIPRDVALPQRIIPVPLHPRRFRERGFNPSTEIAREIGRRLGVPVAASAAVRHRATVSQVGLTAAARARNVRQAFAVEQRLPGDHVAIVDDVMTTGATVHELARVLRQAGAARIDVWVCARAEPGRPEAQ